MSCDVKGRWGLKIGMSLWVASKSPIQVIVSVDHASAIRVFPLLFLSLVREVSVFISASKTLTYPSRTGHWAEVGIWPRHKGERAEGDSRGLGGDRLWCTVGTWECVERMRVCSGIWLSYKSPFHTTSDAPHACFT